MHNKRGTILSVEGQGLDLARKLRIGPPHIKLCQVAPLPPPPPPPSLSFRGLKGLSAGTVITKKKFPCPWGLHCLVVLFLYLYPICALVPKEEALTSPPEHCVTTVKMAV